MEKQNLITMILAIGLIIVAALPIVLEKTNVQREMTFTGTNTALVAPDIGLVSFSVETAALTAQDAQSGNAAKMADILTYLKNQGIPESDLKTTSYRIYQDYTWLKNGSRILTGYRAVNEVTLRTKELTKLGGFLDNVVHFGATNVNDITFELSPEKQSELRETGLVAATQDAKSKADAISTAMNLHSVKVKSISESYNYAPLYRSYDVMAESTSMGTATETPIESGSTTFTVSATVTFSFC